MKDKRNFFDSDDAQDMIDATYNAHDYPIIEKNQNSYVMPLDMQRDVDSIDTARFYEDIPKSTKNVKATNSSKSKKNAKKR